MRQNFEEKSNGVFHKQTKKPYFFKHMSTATSLPTEDRFCLLMEVSEK